MPDHSLIARVQSCTNGENCHIVGNALHVYIAYAEIAHEHKELGHLQTQRDEFERCLRAFCVTGKADQLSVMVQ